MSFKEKIDDDVDGDGEGDAEGENAEENLDNDSRCNGSSDDNCGM